MRGYLFNRTINLMKCPLLGGVSTEMARWHGVGFGLAYDFGTSVLNFTAVWLLENTDLSSSRLPWLHGLVDNGLHAVYTFYSILTRTAPHHEH